MDSEVSIINELWAKRNKALQKLMQNDPNYKPNLAFYITYQCYEGIMKELRVASLSLSQELLHNRTLWGCSVYKTSAEYDRGDKHPMYRIVEIL